jgi:TolB protein
MMHRPLVLLTVSVLIMLAGCGSRQQLGSNDRPQAASVRGGGSNTGKIAFSRLPDGAAPPYNEIYVANEDGTDLTCLTHDPSSDDNPVWLPNGEKIAFVRIGASGENAVYTMNADGTDLNRFRGTPMAAGYPVWSPDGERIAFYEGDYLYVADADGTNEIRLTEKTNLKPNETLSRGSPVWSPEGEKLAFASTTMTTTESSGSAGAATAPASSSPGEGAGIYLVDADGTGMRKLTSIAFAASPASVPAWSPDGDRIAFYDNTDRRYPGAIYVIDADGTARKELPNTTTEQPGLAWSPDGERIVFAKYSDSHSDLCVTNADGTELTRLTDTRGRNEVAPTWSPDGEKIAFLSGPYGQDTTELWVIDADGTGRTHIADGVVSGISWSGG